MPPGAAEFCWGRCWGSEIVPKLIFNKLSVKGIANLCKKGRYSDGQGLYLQVSETGAKSWIFMFRWQGKLKEMGLGSLSNIGLADARKAREAARAILDSGQNPISIKKIENAKRSHQIPTFSKFAQEIINVWSPKWGNPKTLYKWRKMVDGEAIKLANIPINEIATEDILDVLKQNWSKKPETASRTRAQIKAILDAAKVKGLRTGENPATWTGHLAHLLPPPKVLVQGHHKAVPYAKIPKLIQILRNLGSMSAMALEFTILTAARTGEVRFASEAEINIKEKVWEVAAERMKMPRPHRVPLSNRALELVENALEIAGSEHPRIVFRGNRKPELSNMAMIECLQGIKGFEAFTVHGFRSSFRDWVWEATEYPDSMAEAALAHSVGDKVEAAYKRGDALERRRKMMVDWADFCEGRKPKPPLGEVLQ
jgi:integrase